MEFNHIPVLLNETIEGLNIKENGIYADGTAGGGGHSSEILKHLTTGKLISIDRDPDAIQTLTKRFCKNENSIIIKGNFADIAELLKQRGVGRLDGVMLDIGVSSHQLDTAERGFSFHEDAPLDMRMNQEDKLTAEIVVNTYSYEQLRHVIYDYGEEKFASLIAREIVNSREIKPIHTTFELVDVIKKALPNKVLSKVGHPAKQTFLGIRYEVNKEKTEIEIGVDKGINFLSNGGRLAVITFNSLEDGLIKNMFKKYAVKPATDKWVPEQDIQLDYELVTRKPVAPSEREIEANLRSKPAKLRVIERKE